MEPRVGLQPLTSWSQARQCALCNSAIKVLCMAYSDTVQPAPLKTEAITAPEDGFVHLC